RAGVDGLARVLLQMHAGDPDAPSLAVDLDVQVAIDAQGQVVLGDLEVLRHVRIEVVFAVEQRMGGDPAVQGEADPDRVLDGPLVGDWEGSRVPEANRADVRVGGRPEVVQAAAEHLRSGGELDVALQADDGLVGGDL